MSQVVNFFAHIYNCTQTFNPSPPRSGTGKTWSAKQLCHCMATALSREDAPSRVPIFISAQELARMMRGTEASARTGDLFHMYIDSLHDRRKDVKEMLLDAYTKRTAVLILDGLVSCSSFDLHSGYLWNRVKYHSYLSDP